MQTVVLLLWALVLGTAAPGALRAQAVTTSAVGGRVTNAEGQPVASARVTVTNTATGAVSSTGARQDGRYLIPGLQPGTYRIQVSSLGLATQTRSAVTLTLGQTAALDFTLSPEAVALEGITVVGASNGVISTTHTG
ncbi:MAG: carboxypeptidase regulatory-like domain-containing protein, partial [Gemmatimonadetes bacterium]|nr:carboxypeptidase regulatory-like domain-containing protein [Gemmatimonadota bacterium]